MTVKLRFGDFTQITRSHTLDGPVDATPAIGAVAGCMVAPVVFLDPNMMAGILLYAFAGALLGGIDNPLGAVLGGFAVGVIENLGGAYLVGTELKLTMALVIIVAVLTIKPTGLMGRKVYSRV